MTSACAFRNGLALLCISAVGFSNTPSADAVPMHVTYLWHMHQPIYYPYETVNQTDANGHYPFNVAAIFGDRTGNYTTWPRDAVQQGQDKGMPHAGAQCSFSGSLGENLNGLWGDASTASWDNDYDWARNGLRTSLNNPRLDMVAFPYHHSLMPLTCPESRRMQIRLHKEIYSKLWDTAGGYSKGIFPAENAFAESIIPELVQEGLQWALVDNIHFDRACVNYPWNSGGNVYRANAADVQNPDPGNWVQLQNVWAPTKVSAPFGYQPHYVQYVDPWSSPTNPTVWKIIAVPTARYEGNENARGGYGAFKPENVWTANIGLNTDAAHPMLMVCASDGDNYGLKNADAWHAQHGFMLDMCNNNANFDSTTVQDYLDMFPPATNDIIHVEPGSWSGADNGDPEFKKWFADPPANSSDPCPDRFSWSVLIAAQNRVIMADNLENTYSMNDVQWGIGADTAKAWHYYLNAEASDYWYWDSDWSAPWNGNVTRACNLAMPFADAVINRHSGVDNTPPSIFPPQRDPYNPGGKEWNEATNAPSDFEVLTYVYDASGLTSVTLRWRTDNDGQDPVGTFANELYADTPSEVGSWNSVAMTGSFDPSNKGPDNIVPNPTYRAQTYKAMITGQHDVLIDYYVEAIDTHSNVRRSEIKHVVVGATQGGPAPVPVTFTPVAPEICTPLVTTYNPQGRVLSNASPVFLNITFDNFATGASNYQMVATGTGKWIFTNAIPATATNAIVYLSNSGATLIDNNTNANWKIAISACSTGPVSSVDFNPAVPNGCTNVTVTYHPNFGPLKTATNVYLHIGRNGWQDVITPNPPMTPGASGTWTYVYAPPAGTLKIDVVFNNGASTWDNNGGNDWHVNVTNCADSIVTQGITLVAGSPVVLDDPATQNNIGEKFDFATNGGSIATINQGGFGSFGQIFVNYDATNFYIGGYGCDMVGNNNAMVIFLEFNTLGDNRNNLWNEAGAPQGLDFMHNVWLNPGMDIAIVLGDEWGDGEYPSFQLGNGYDFGQGLFYLSATSFVQVAGAKLAQFDGTGTNATLTGDDDTNRLMRRWEASIPWSSLGATGVASISSCAISGLIASDGTNGVDRYLSGNYIGETAAADSIFTNNFGFRFVTLTAKQIVLPNGDADGDGIPDAWEVQHFGYITNCTWGGDSDGDGFSNGDEYRLGTDPTNAASALELVQTTTTTTGQYPQVTWDTVGGKSYRVEFSDHLVNGFSNITQVIEDDVAQGVESTETFTDDYTLTGGAPTNGARNYRILFAP